MDSNFVYENNFFSRESNIYDIVNSVRNVRFSAEENDIFSADL